MTTAVGGSTATVTRMPEPATMPEPAAALAEIDGLVADVMASGVRRVHVLAWRDLDDPDAGGSEVHADEFMRRWAAAGLDIVHRTSAAAGLPADRPAQRLRRHPPGQPLLGVPAHRRLPS